MAPWPRFLVLFRKRYLVCLRQGGIVLTDIPYTTARLLCQEPIKFDGLLPMYAYYKFNAVFHDVTIELSKYVFQYNDHLGITHANFLSKQNVAIFFSAVCLFFLDRRRDFVMLSCEA